MSTENGAVAVAGTAIAKQERRSPLVELGARFSIEPAKLIEVLRGTVIKPDSRGKAATNEEVAAFCIVANQYGLNPFTREIHAFTSGDKGVVPIVGIDGWTHIVNGRDDFDGCEFIEKESADGAPMSVTCIMHVKGRQHPVQVTERFSECKRQTIPWQTMPWRMLRHKAYMQAARYAFGLAGIYDEDEGRDIIVNAKPVEFEKVETAAPPVSLSARMGLPAAVPEEPKADPAAAKPTPEEGTIPPQTGPADPAPVDVPAATEPKQTSVREIWIAAIKQHIGPDSPIKASTIDALMKSVGVDQGSGEAWEMLPDDKMETLYAMLTDEANKKHKPRGRG